LRYRSCSRPSEFACRTWSSTAAAMRPLYCFKSRMQIRKRASRRCTASQPDGDFARSCRQGGAMVQAARSYAAREGCAVHASSRGVTGERSAPRPPPLHPHAHALPSPSSPCACRRLHRGNPPRAMGALPAAGRCEPAQCTRRPSLSRRKAWQRWELSLSCTLCARVRRCGHAGALRRLCSAPACPACCLIA